MLENTDKAVAELLEKLPEIIKGASGQLPDIANQLLIYGAFDAQVGIGSAVILMFVAVVCGFKWLFMEGEFCGFIGFFLFVMSLVWIGCGVSTLYKISHAPKVYLLEKSMDYIQKK